MRVLGQIGNFALGLGGKGCDGFYVEVARILDRRSVVIFPLPRRPCLIPWSTRTDKDQHRSL